MVNRVKVFDIESTTPSGQKKNIFTSNKIEADKFLFEAVFEPQVSISYIKTEMEKDEYEFMKSLKEK